MGYVELVDGVGSRRIHVPGFAGAIRIEIHGDTRRVVVPEGVDVRRERGANEGVIRR